ncbi:MAG TPA: tetratricopeptide repeat protein [Pyrinomonadaceae bacterium]|jgi:Tfp pilus assembly protein PilF|nr:tetratricopeptide repeat protein [Pyrinomonadaceae bacterium]
MFCLKTRVLTRHKYQWILLTLLFALLAPVIANGQGGVGSTRGLPESAGGSHRIQGSIFLPNGLRAGPGVIVRLDGNVGTRRASTDGSGEFAFNSLPAADYALTVDGGPDYEVTRQQVVIYGNTGNVGMGNSGDTTKIDVQLKAKAVSDAILFVGVPQAAVDSYKKAMESARAGNRKKAVDELNSAVTAYPNFSLALRELGAQYLQLKEMEKLAETMEALLKLTPDDPKAHLNLGIALWNQKKYPEAETHLRESLRLANADSIAHYYLGLTLLSEKKYGDAEKEIEFAVNNGAENIAQAHRYLGGLYMSSKNPKAADELEKYLKLDPKAADVDKIKAIIKDLRTKQP